MVRDEAEHSELGANLPRGRSPPGSRRTRGTLQQAIRSVAVRARHMAVSTIDSPQI